MDMEVKRQEVRARWPREEKRDDKENPSRSLSTLRPVVRLFHLKTCGETTEFLVPNPAITAPASQMDDSPGFGMSAVRRVQGVG